MTRPTLLLLPGLLCDRTVWLHQAAALSPHATCIVPGYDDLDAIPAMAQAVLSAAPEGPLMIAGHSMGGRVALEIARLAPQRVSRLALLDTGTDPLAGGAAGADERARRMALLQTARRDGMRAMGEQWARGMVHPSRVGTPVFESILAMIERSTPDRFQAQLHALLARPDARPVFSALQCPTLLVCGRQDGWSPLARHEEMQRALPHARLAVIEDSGHMTTMEQPEAVSRALLQWLKEGIRT
ncbi:MAG TPA: alpha/beta hydrolase [Ramlibacter sp.]|nr:alpha/beta hydrolase [Ramlibacter sp.]